MSSSASNDNLQQFLVGLTDTLGIFGAIFSFTASLLKVSNAFISILFLCISGLSLIISIISLITYTRTIDYLTPSFGIGMIIAILLGLFALGLILTKLSYVNFVWILLITITALILSLMKIENVLNMIITQDFEPMKNPSIVLDVSGFTLGTTLMLMVEPDKRYMSVLFMWLYSCVSFVI